MKPKHRRGRGKDGRGTHFLHFKLIPWRMVGKAVTNFMQKRYTVAFEFQIYKIRGCTKNQNKTNKTKKNEDVGRFSITKMKNAEVYT